jgi:hypothetical protein
MDQASNLGCERLMALWHVRDQLIGLLELSDQLDELLLSAQLAHALDCAETRAGSFANAPPAGCD